MERCVLNHPVKRIEFSDQRPNLQHPHSGVSRFTKDHIVWWYNSLRSNSKGQRTIPEVEVLFKTLDNDVPSVNTCALVPLAALPLYSIGSIWREGQCVSNTEMETRIFDVDFSPGTYQVTSRAELLDSQQGALFLDDDYPLKFKRDMSRLLNFRLNKENNLLVPCIEFFVRAYATKMTICKLLSTTTFEQAKMEFFKSQARHESKWLIQPTDAMIDADAVFLAHLLYDDHCHEQVKKLNTSIVINGPDVKVFPLAEPWFRGAARLRCRGRWINGGKTFLCLNILGTSSPSGPDIELFRESFDSSDGEQGGRTVLPQVTNVPEEGEFVAEESYDLPDAKGEKAKIKLPPVETLGPGRVVKKTKSVAKTKRGLRGPQPPSADTYSGGDELGQGKNIGKLEHLSDAVLESQGFLLDIWNAFISIKEANAERVTDVSWYAPPNYGTSTPPRVILFDRTGLAEKKLSVWRWVKPFGSTQHRGLMVLKIVVDEQTFFCFEIDRLEKQGREFEAQQDKKPATRGFSGVLMKAFTNDPAEFQNFVEEVCIRIRNERGIFKNIIEIFPPQSKLIVHRSKDRDVKYRKRLINVFIEDGITLK